MIGYHMMNDHMVNVHYCDISVYRTCVYYYHYVVYLLSYLAQLSSPLSVDMDAAMDYESFGHTIPFFRDNAPLLIVTHNSILQAPPNLHPFFWRV